MEETRITPTHTTSRITYVKYHMHPQIKSLERVQDKEEKKKTVTKQKHTTHAVSVESNGSSW